MLEIVVFFVCLFSTRTTRISDGPATHTCETLCFHHPNGGGGGGVNVLMCYDALPMPK